MNHYNSENWQSRRRKGSWGGGARPVGGRTDAGATPSNPLASPVRCSAVVVSVALAVVRFGRSAVQNKTAKTVKPVKGK